MINKSDKLGAHLSAVQLCINVPFSFASKASREDLEGATVSEITITKHRNDIFRLLQGVAASNAVRLHGLPREHFEAFLRIANDEAKLIEVFQILPYRKGKLLEHAIAAGIPLNERGLSRVEIDESLITAIEGYCVGFQWSFIGSFCKDFAANAP